MLKYTFTLHICKLIYVNPPLDFFMLRAVILNTERLCAYVDSSLTKNGIYLKYSDNIYVIAGTIIAYIILTELPCTLLELY
jgi:hypothetical protein